MSPFRELSADLLSRVYKARPGNTASDQAARLCQLHDSYVNHLESLFGDDESIKGRMQAHINWLRCIETGAPTKLELCDE